ncbi:hypothetical protein [Phenylobacterium sp.]|uniref:hypothetical protein n=1 Tax=Phenylobacterium sp. TaxID=1871053 RepID=UPI00271E4D85|nr:hypothetical protein [Phenylobacterium sp.]MDO8801077.1 hypothetical protein [Phenylobacterium sp.]
MTDRRVHIVAYETSGHATEMVVGATDLNRDNAQQPVLRPKNHRAGAIFVMEDVHDDGAFYFRHEASGLYLAHWGFRQLALTNKSTKAADNYALQCKMDGLDPSPWVAINNHKKDRVIDIDHGVMTDGRSLCSFPWNDGKNQWWRLQDA